MKDVYFNKEEVFDDNTNTLKYNMKNIFFKDLVKIVKKAIRIVMWQALARVILFPALGQNLPYLPNGLGRSSPSR